MANPVIEFLALLGLIFYPAVPVILILIHKTIGYWRRIGRASYYFFVGLFLIFDIFAAVLVWNFRDGVLIARLYSHPAALIGVLVFFSGVLFSFKIIQTLTFRVLMGFPEIEPAKNRQKLVSEGINRFIRHPRYLEFILETAGLALVSGLLANFILAAYMIAGLYIAARFEERELIDRFGEAYLEYREKTGMFLPKIHA